MDKINERGVKKRNINFKKVKDKRNERVIKK